MNTNGFFTSPTIRKSQLLRPFSQMNGLTNNTEYSSYTKAREIQVSFEKRFSKGWNLNLAYTGMRLREADFFANEFDSKRTERFSNDGRPHRFTGTAVYELPFGKGRRLLPSSHRALDMILGGWQAAARVAGKQRRPTSSSPGRSPTSATTSTTATTPATSPT